MLNIFNTINFREKVNIDVNETGKRLILEEWEKIDQELREKIVMAKMAILCRVKDLLQKKQSMVILPFLEHYFVFLNKDTNKYQFVFLFDKKVGRKKTK
ncbi:hypothetical protein [Spiroplasma endosymbiont of Stenodema calcarata]|uniref:hypothetical protein n=1 Tax=Spiroplasma endosymbiont of Stenodema calcarata TaxID=3139328 RepID=UPI003CCAF852